MVSDLRFFLGKLIFDSKKSTLDSNQLGYGEYNYKHFNLHFHFEFTCYQKDVNQTSYSQTFSSPFFLHQKLNATKKVVNQTNYSHSF